MSTTSDDQKWQAMCRENDAVQAEVNAFYYDENKQIATTARPWEPEYELAERRLADVRRRMREFTVERFGREK